MSITDLAIRLAAARSSARLAELTPADSLPSVEDAYRVQTQLAALAHGDVRGWKVTALTAPEQRKYAASRPVAGLLLGPYVQSAPGRLPLSSLVTPLLECEVAFVLGDDLPPRAEPYDRSHVEDAIAAVVAAFEFADSRVPASSPDLMKLADAMGNGLFITGPRIDDWRRLDLTDIPITLTRDGAAIERGNSARILGNPLLAVVALANAQPLPGPGLKAGQIVTTGTCTTPLAVSAGKFVGHFGPLGEIELTIVP